MTSEEILRSEFAAEDGSFLVTLRTSLEWDEAAFQRLTAAMRDVARAYEGKEDLPRWLAEGFWFVDSFVASWIAHPRFPRTLPDSHYTNACEELHGLAAWLFTGSAP